MTSIPAQLMNTRFVTLLLCLATTPGAVAGQDTTWRSDLANLVAREMADKDIPAFGIVVVDRTGVVAEVALGRMSRDDSSGVTASTLFRTGSVGKTVTDFALMAASDAALVDIDADVRRYLPDFSPDNPFDVPITLHRLMTHTAGLVREPPVGNYYDDSSPSLEATVRSLNRTSLVWSPGDRTKYSNAGVAVVGRVLEVVYRMPFAEVIDSLVFKPAGMSLARVGLDAATRARLARGIMWHPVTGETWEAPLFDLGMAPAGDMYASLRDMAALMTSLLNRDGRIVTRETEERMWVPQRRPTPTDWQLDVGIGFSLNGRFAGRYRMARNGGAVYGYASELALLPEEGLGVYAVGAREVANRTVQSLAHWALEAALAMREGRPPPGYELSPRAGRSVADRLAACATSGVRAEWSSFAGRYGPEHNPLVICQLDDRLHAQVEWYSLYPLTEAGDGVFTFPSYALFGQEELRFELADGRIAEVLIGRGVDGVRFRRQPGSR